MRIPYFKQFNTSLYWNLIDSVGTQILLLMHHMLVRLFLGPAFHGSFSCILSFLYLGIMLFNFGFDLTLAPFFTAITASKHHFIKLLRYYMLSQALILALGLLVISLLHAHLFYTSIVFDRVLYTLFGYTFIFESVKKTAKFFLQLNFLNKITALVEILGMLCYLLLFWTIYRIGSITTVTHTWGVLAVVSTIQAGILLYWCYQLYSRLPNQDESTTMQSISLYDVTKLRFFTFSNQLVVQLFSGNFLVPLCAFKLGAQQASFIKIVSSFSQILSTVAQKIFGIASNAVFAHITTKPLAERRETFSSLSYKLHQAIYALGIFLIINIRPLITTYHQWHLGGEISLASWAIVYVFFILSFIESFFALYERWYTVEKRADIFFVFNLLSFIILYVLLPSINIDKLFFTLLVGIRLGMFVALSGFSFYYWKIKPTFKINKSLLIVTIVSALVFNILLTIATSVA